MLPYTGGMLPVLSYPAWVCASPETVHTSFHTCARVNGGVKKSVNTNITNQPDPPYTSPMSPAQPLMHLGCVGDSSSFMGVHTSLHT